MSKPPEAARPAAPNDPHSAAGPESLLKKVENYERWIRSLDNHVRVLEAERQRHAALVLHTEAGFLHFDTEARVVWTNANFDRLFQTGQPDREPVGLSCHQALCRKPSPCPGCPTAAAIASGRAAQLELNVFMGAGFHPVLVNAVPVEALDGHLEQVLVMFQDLSSLQILQRSEEALRAAEQRHRSIFEQAGAGMLTIRSDGSFLQTNPTFCTMLGYTESSLLRMKLIEVVHFDDRDKVERWLREASKGKLKHVEAEYRFVRHDMNFVWCHCTSVWQYDEKGRSTHAVMLIQDVSERKHAELELEQSKRRYQALVHSIDGIVWEADPRVARFSFVSKQAQRILGHPLERWITQPRFWRNNIHPEDLERVVKALEAAVGEQRGHEIEYRMVAADGRAVWLNDSVSPVIERGKVAKLRGLMVDVTERKAAEEALRQSEEQLRQSQKMEAIGRLAGGIAHDFNNLLTAITGYGELLLGRLGEGNPLRREATEIAKAAQRAAALTGQLLAFSRQQVLQPKVIDLNDVIGDMELMLRRLIGEHIEFVTRLAACHGVVKADPGQMHQVLLNLVVNARDAMAGGGVLTLQTADVDFVESDSERPPGVAPGSYVTLTVRDTGCGMDDQTKSRLFEPFFTTKEQGKGTGLGLSTVYGIVTQSGGQIAVVSSPGSGSTFTIYLPRVHNEAEEIEEQREAVAVAAPAATGGTERILLVEDDDSVRELAREILEMNGYSVLEATNGVEALKVFEGDPGTIDLMVTDLVMPQMGGRDLADRVAPLHPELRVLYLSGYTDSVAIQQGMLDEGSSFLQKPFTPVELARKVRESLDG